MNRIYKVIYSRARQCAMVVSELAKSSHKNSRKGAGHVGTPALARIIAAALVAGTLTWGGVPEVSWAADNTAVTDSNGNTVTKDINANITGKKNTVTDSSNAEIVGDGNTVTNEAKGEDGSVRYVRSNDARIHGSGNTISASLNQQVIGDNNTIMGRDDGTVTDYQHPEGREPNVSDLTIGRGNFIRSTDTYRNEWDSLKVIGNNNRADMKIESAGGPAAGIVIGDNQNIDNIKDSIVIGSLSPSEQSDKIVLDESLKDDDEHKYTDKYFVGSNSIVVGYHATSSKDASIVIGNRSKVSRNFQTVTGLRSTIEGNYYNGLNYLDGQSGNFASIYGSFNKIEDATGEGDMDGVGNSINGSMNVTSNARGTLIMGVGNTVTHSKGEFILPKDDAEDDSEKNTGDWLEAGMWSAGDYALGRDLNNDPNLTYPADQTYAVMRDAWQHYMETSGGAVSVLGNSNTSDYAIRSQILGTNNMLKGAEGNISSYNTISGFSNTGENVKRTAIVGTGNTLRNSEDNVVIGDYHNLENGKHNVILGSMASEEKAVPKTAKAAWAVTDDNPDGTYTYTVNEQVALKPNPKVIKNAVMVGYNTDVTQDGGVALGSDSIASTEAGKIGYDAKGKKHAKSDNDYAAWVSSDAAVSVGGADREVTYDVLDKDGKPVIDKATGKKKQETQIVKSTRQITNVAAGTEGTDAANVAQLKTVDKKIAVIFDDKGSLMSTDAKISHEIFQDSVRFPQGEGQSIAIGKGASAFMQGGWKSYFMLFGMEKAAGAIAIGEGAQALSQSIDIGNRTYTGEIGDVKISDYGNWGTGSGVASVLLGTNSYTGGTLSTLIGDYSIMSTGYPNGYGGNSGDYLQNAGAVSVGALNSIESATSSFSSSGVANSIVGLANKTNNANGALIYGAGNEITNSSSYISAPTSGNSAKSAADSLRTSIKNNPGGAVLAIGGGNKADWTQRTQIIGVANTVQGSKDKPSIYNMIDGYNATLNNSSHIYTIGYRNDFSNENNSIVIGDYHQLTNGKNNIVIGSYDGSYQPADEYAKTPEKTTYLTNDKLEDAVILGHNANATVNGGVALGYGSVASTKEGVPGYDPLTGNQITSTDDIKWKSSWAAVSIGDSTHTRQITNLAAGSNDTDAVNVAQLKAVAEKIGPAMNFVAGDGISIVKKDGVYTISANIKGGSTDTDVVKVDNVEPEKPGEGGNTSGSTGDTPVTPSVNPGNSGNTENPGSADNTSNGKELVITADTKPTTFAADKGSAAVKPGETLKINGDKNITTTASTTTASDHGIAHGIAISLNKDIKVDSVTAGGVTINKDKKGTIGGLTNTTWDAANITSGQAATEDQLKAATKNAVNYDGDDSKTVTLRENTTIKNVANTTIEEGSKNAVNAGTVYNETRVAKDGNFIRQANTAGENLTALDNQVTSNTQNINYLNGRVGELGDRINKVGAGAAALAALHPLDFDPDDKWDFAAGVGNYRNATAAAVGLFYRPNERTMFNLGWTMGDNRNMVNGGFSVKFGKSNKYVKYSKAEMASVIDNQSREIAELKAKDAQNAKDNAEMRAEIEALKKQVEALAAKK